MQGVAGIRGAGPKQHWWAEEAERAAGTWLLIGLNLVVFLYLICRGVSPLTATSEELVRFGGLYPAQVVHWGWWRLLTAQFLHEGLGHLSSNMIALYYAGKRAEQLLGRGRFLLIYLLSGLAGALVCSLYNPYLVHVGASGAIFGVFGALLGFALQADERGEMLERLKYSILFFLFLSFYPGGASGNIDYAWHAGGLATGFLLGVAVGQGSRTQSEVPFQAAALLLLPVLAAGVIRFPKVPDVLADLDDVKALLKERLPEVDRQIRSRGEPTTAEGYRETAALIHARLVVPLEQGGEKLRDLGDVKDPRIARLLAGVGHVLDATFLMANSGAMVMEENARVLQAASDPTDIQSLTKEVDEGVFTWLRMMEMRDGDCDRIALAARGGEETQALGKVLAAAHRHLAVARQVEAESFVELESLVLSYWKAQDAGRFLQLLRSASPRDAQVVEALRYASGEMTRHQMELRDHAARLVGALPESEAHALDHSFSSSQRMIRFAQAYGWELLMRVRFRQFVAASLHRRVGSRTRASAWLLQWMIDPLQENHLTLSTSETDQALIAVARVQEGRLQVLRALDAAVLARNGRVFQQAVRAWQLLDSRRVAEGLGRGLSQLVDTLGRKPAPGNDRGLAVDR